MKNIINSLLHTFLVITVFLLLPSCNSEEPDIPPHRTILVYIAANNSLGDYGCDYSDINEMKSAALAGHIGHGNRLLIFHAPRSGSKILYEMDSEGELSIIKEYDTSTSVIESDFMLGVFNDAKAWAPAPDYGLIMWSHALGWTQDGQEDNGPIATPKTWGEDRGRTMNISTLKRVLKESPWSWVYFDCCFMGSVEVAYELAPVLDKMVASSTEVPLDGMPYEKNIPLLFKDTPDLVGAARNTFQYYNNLNGSSRTCTIGVYDLTKMNSLATATKNIYQYTPSVNAKDFNNLPLDIYTPHLFYDYGVFINGLFQFKDVDAELIKQWKEAYADVVIFHASTPMLWNRIDLSDSTGLSTYLPDASYQATNSTYKNYESLSWYKDVAKYIF